MLDVAILPDWTCLLLAKRWLFPVEGITCARLFLWHGKQERIMPVAPARRAHPDAPMASGHACATGTYRRSGSLYVLQQALFLRPAASARMASWVVALHYRGLTKTRRSAAWSGCVCNPVAY
jgi:hypothetical protein